MIWKQAQSSPVTYNHNSSNWSLIKIEILRSLTYLVKVQDRDPKKLSSTNNMAFSRSAMCETF
jgi:hypothetical protein